MLTLLRGQRKQKHHVELAAKKQFFDVEERNIKKNELLLGSLHDILIFIALLHLLELFRWYIRVALFATYFLVVVPSKRNYALYCWAKYNHFVRIQHLLVP